MLSEDLANLAGAIDALRHRDGSLHLGDDRAAGLVAMLGLYAASAAWLEGNPVPPAARPTTRDLVTDLATERRLRALRNTPATGPGAGGAA